MLRRTAKRVMHFRMAAAAFGGLQLSGFSAVASVGELETALAVEDEFGAIMSRWSKRKTVSSASAARACDFDESLRGLQKGIDAMDFCLCFKCQS